MEDVNREEKMARKWKAVEKEDCAFWDAVDDLLAQIGPVLGLRESNRMAYMPGGPGDKRSRIVASQATLEAEHPVNQVYRWLSMSPDCCISRNGYAITMAKWPVSEMVFDRLTWVELLQDMCDGGWIRAVAPQADKVWSGGTAEDIRLPSGVIYAEDVKAVLKKVEIVFNAWQGYIRRHSICRIRKKDDGWYFTLLIKKLEEQRNHAEAIKPSLKLQDSLEYFFLVDKTLCVIFPNVPIRSGNSGALTGERFDFFMKYNGFQTQQKAMLVEMLRLYQRKLIGLEKQSGLQEQSTALPLQGRTGEHYYLYGQFVPRRVGRCAAEKKRNPPLPEDEEAFKEFLYELAGGDWEKLCTWAKIAACCHANEKLFPGVIYYVPTEEKNRVMDIQLKIYEVFGVPIVYKEHPELSQLLNDQAVDFLISMKTLGERFVICHAAKLKLRKEKWGRLKKLLSGATVSAPDPVLKRKLHKNTAQWVIAGDENTLQTLKAHEIPVLLIPDVGEIKQVPQGAVTWAEFFMPLWGFLLLTKKESGKKVNIKLPVVDHFFRKCCKVTEEKVEFLPARVLYDAYLDFCEKHGYRDRLLFKDFNDVMEESYGQKPVRYHRTKTENKSGYWNIRLLTEEEPEVSVEQKEMSRDEFFRRVEQFLKEVLEHFPPTA